MDKQVVYLIISIDTECDKGPGWLIQKPISFQNIVEGLSRNLMPVLNKYGVKPTFLLSPEVLRDQKSVRYFKALDNAELGTHLHEEFIEPEETKQPDRTKNIQGDLNPEVERKKLKNLTDLFIDTFGYQPLSFRAGRFGLSKFTNEFLNDLGYKVDSSVTPFKSHFYESGSVNNFWGFKPYPYRIEKTELVQVPVTIINKGFDFLPSFVLRSLGTKNTLTKRILRRMGYSGESQWLRPWKSSFVDLCKISQSVVQNAGVRPVVFNMMFHSNEVWPAASPYCQNQEEVNEFCNTIDQYLKFLFAHYKVCSTGLGEYASYFR